MARFLEDEALRVYREHRAAGRRGLPPDAPLDFAPTALQPLIRMIVRPLSRLDGKEDEIRHFLELGVSKTAIAKITGVSRPTLYSFMSTRGLRTPA